MNMRDPQEPVFTIKAKDALAVPTLRAYKQECIEHGLDQQAEQVELAIKEMVWWQKNHEVKFPDHQHVPHKLAEQPK